MGHTKVTKQNLKIIEIDNGNNILIVKGSVPGKKNSVIFLKGFTRITGTELLQQQIENGLSEYQIKKSWSKDLNEFKKIRKKYLIYP